MKLNTSSDDNVREQMEHALRTEAHGILKMITMLGEDHERAVDLIFELKGRVIVTGVGKSDHIGRRIAAALASTGTPAQFLHSTEASHDLGMITPNGTCLYFSKEVIPYTDANNFENNAVPVYHHVGVYAYRPRALAAYGQWSEGKREKQEGLEQLRFLENGARLKYVEVHAHGHPLWELNNPEDVARIEAALSFVE